MSSRHYKLGPHRLRFVDLMSLSQFKATKLRAENRVEKGRPCPSDVVSPKINRTNFTEMKTNLDLENWCQRRCLFVWYSRCTAAIYVSKISSVSSLPLA